MDKYLIMLYVSLEQEKALRKFFCDNDWPFYKPDLTKITDKVGPLIPDITLTQDSPDKSLPQDSPDIPLPQDSPDIPIPQDSPVTSKRPSKPSVKKLKNPGVQRKTGVARRTNLTSSKPEVSTETVQLPKNLDETEPVIDPVEILGDDRDDSTVMDGTDTYSENMEDERAEVVEENDEEEGGEEEHPKRKTAGCRKSGRVRRMSNKLRQNYEDNGGIGLKRSWRTVKTEQIFSCKECDLDFDDDLKLSEHLEEVHAVKVKEELLEEVPSPLHTGTEFPFKRRRCVPRDPNTETNCGICEKVFVHKDLGDHYKAEHNVSVKYIMCGDGFCRKHFSCEQCMVMVGKLPKIVNHIRRVHGLNGQPPTGRKRSDFKKEKKVKKEKRLHMCLVCDETFASMTAVDIHQKEVHGIGRKKSTRVNEKVHICETCGKVYRRSDYLKYHIDVAHLGIAHHKPIPKAPRSVCDVCGASFARKGSLIEHINSVHSQGPFEHQCDQCPMSFTRKGRLEHHMNKCHLNMKPFRCDKCQVTFYSGRALHQHKILCNMDDAEKFKCKECGHRVSSQHNLDMHIQAMHQDPALSCPCGTVVRWRSSIAKHKRRCRLNKFKHQEHNFAEENGEMEENDQGDEMYEEIQEENDPSGEMYEEMKEDDDQSGEIYEHAEAKVDDANVVAVEEIVDNPWGNEVLDKSEHIQTHVEEVSEEHVEIIVKEATDITDPNLAGVIDAEVVAAVEQVVEDGTLDLGSTGEVVYETDSTLTVQQVGQGSQKLYYIINYSK